MPSTTCSNLLPVYRTWKSSLTEMRRAMVAYQASGDEADRIAFDYAMKNGEAAREKYQQEAYEKMVKRVLFHDTSEEDEAHELCSLDAHIVDCILKCFSERRTDVLNVGSEDGRVTQMERSHAHEDISVDGDTFLRYAVLLKKLTSLVAPSTATHLPEAFLPDLRLLDLSGSRIQFLQYQLPKSVTSLSLCRTGITSFPHDLPPKLQFFSCNDTPMEYLPVLPDSVQQLFCKNSKLRELPRRFPLSLTLIDIEGTPAARDPEIRARLDKFKEDHPNAQVKY